VRERPRGPEYRYAARRCHSRGTVGTLLPEHRSGLASQPVSTRVARRGAPIRPMAASAALQQF